MFRAATAAAAKYTVPIILSRKTVGGDVGSGLGAIIILNDDGWFFTAFHILQQALTEDEQAKAVIKFKDDTAAIEANKSLSNAQKREQLKALGRLNPKSVEKSSIWLPNNWAITDLRGLEAIDLGVGRLVGYDPSAGHVKGYPVFKNPAVDYEPGESVCRLGFPFHSFDSTYDETSGAFSLPPGTIPVPRFISDGVISRFIDLFPLDGSTPVVPLKWFETSTAGLKGQSGGPIYDAQARVWGIQVNTATYPLGFEPEIKDGGVKRKLPQFLNVGRGVHALSLLEVAKDLGINIQVSQD
jgi:hypothetical protein